jgi:tetratricopeptide (TPR) repeat protein
MKLVFAVFLFFIMSICIIPAHSASTKDVIKLLTQASQFLCNNEYDKAIEKCGEITAIEPKCSGAYYLRGFAYRYKGEYDLSIMDFTQTLRIDPKYSAAYYGRAISFAYKQMYPEAIADFTSAIELDPKYRDAYFNRARVYYDMEEYDRAWDDLNKARALGLEEDLLYRGFIKKLQDATGRFQ